MSNRWFQRAHAGRVHDGAGGAGRGEVKIQRLEPGPLYGHGSKLKPSGIGPRILVHVFIYGSMLGLPIIIFFDAQAYLRAAVKT